MRGLAAVLLVAMTSGAALLSGQALFRTGIEVVEVDVSVMRGANPVVGLTAADFTVTDAGVPQVVQSAVVNDLPLRVTLTLDVSGSLAGNRMESLIRAGRLLARELRETDHAALVTFSEVARQPVAMGMPLSQFTNALGTLQARGATALRDAVHLTLATQADHTRSLVLLFSDGQDTSSWLREGQILEEARRTNVVVHVVRFRFDDDGFLDRLVQVTGGRSWTAASDKDLEPLFAQALNEMRSRYVITYTPTGTRSPGWHPIEVALKQGRATVTARPGYFVPASPQSPAP